MIHRRVLPRRLANGMRRSVRSRILILVCKLVSRMYIPLGILVRWSRLAFLSAWMLDEEIRKNPSRYTADGSQDTAQWDTACNGRHNGASTKRKKVPRYLTLFARRSITKTSRDETSACYSLATAETLTAVHEDGGVDKKYRAVPCPRLSGQIQI
ncbi:hypothetical protein PYCCODRAFT_1265367 [Trametes coccinea BRFM310]|uniref:Uncharacterized protein n=1 Tax=Trametes coccinea (strain BRFM310) TaxID=1353009 RepID=A0A1Y2I8C5_TRAC3|nr:hypothetical protein PYCCODRAFT_1265367 [Trametes coccinea BRFM310]